MDNLPMCPLDQPNNQMCQCPDGAILNGFNPDGTQIKNNICLKTAQDLVQNWINLCNETILKPNHITPTVNNMYKGFWIPIEDIQNLAKITKDNNWTGLTAYLALDNDNITLKGILVPCNYDSNLNTYKDICVDPNNGNSLIYDFTSPCPQQCDLTGDLGSILPNN